MEKVTWRLYYENGSTFTNLDGSPEDTPAYGFICAAFPDHDREGNSIGRMVMWGWDRYFYHEDYNEWWGCDRFGLDDRMGHRLPVRAVLFGRTVHTTVFREIFERAANDPDFPAKSGKKRIETPVQNQGPQTQGMIDGA